MFDCRKALWAACVAGTILCCQAVARAQPLSGEQPPAPANVLEITPSLLPSEEVGPYPVEMPLPKSNSYPAGDYAAQLSSASGQGPYACDWGWGCGGSPYQTGPGQCDNWRVGPVWKVEVDGLIMFHEDAPLRALIDRSNALQDPLSTAVPDYTADFGERPGVRISATSYWPQMAGYEVNVTYTGVPTWSSSAVFPTTDFIDEDFNEIEVDRLLTYSTGFHSLELNFIPFNDSPWKRFLGIRYFRVDENIRDSTREYGVPPIEPDSEMILADLLNATVVDNNLIGFQGGIRRDVWRFRPWLFIEGFANAGIYVNVIKREDIRANSIERFTVTDNVMIETRRTTMNNIERYENGQLIETVAEEEINEFELIESETFESSQPLQSVIKTRRTQLAFAGEAELALVCKLNRCLALRSGYQAILIDGVELADDAFLNLEPERESRFYHGFFGGLEYRR